LLRGDERNFFIGTELDGLQQIRLSGFTHFYPGEPAIPSSFLEDRSGRIWAGTHRGGIYIFSPGQKDKSTPNNIVRFDPADLNISPASTITGLLEDRDGNIWIGTSRQELIIYDGKTFSTCFLPPDSGAVPGGNANVIFYRDRYHDNIVIGSYSGLYLYEGTFDNSSAEKKFIHYTTASGLSSNNIVALTGDAEGKIWIGTRADGVNVLDLQKNSGERVTHYNNKSGLPDNHIFSMVTDLKGRIWTGTEAGLAMFHRNGFTVFSTAEGLTDNLVTTLVCDSSNRIWPEPREDFQPFLKTEIPHFP
jgi:ligand-binding sensor domain-containing protein